MDFETPVVLSGRDATGETYRDETITEIVNIHGARVRTGRKILVGMLVTIECTKTGRGSKGVCVNVYEPTPESPHPAIAMQLLQPGNHWGVENPPSDWATALAATAPGASPVDSSWSGVAEKASSAPRVKTFPMQQPAPTVGTLKAPADQVRMAAEESLAKLRDEAEMITRNALAAYDQRLTDRMTEADARLSQRTEEAAAELAAAVQTLKASVVADLVKISTEELQARLPGLSREHEERLDRHVGQLMTESAERTAAKSAEEVQASEAVLEQLLGGMMRKAEADLASRVSEALQGLEVVINTFRASFTDDLSAQNEKSIQEAEQILRERFAAMLSSIMTPPSSNPVAKK